MKTQSQITDRIRFLLVQELDRRVDEASRRLPHLCTHNHQQPLDTRKLVEGSPNDSFNRVADSRGLPVVQTMGLCMLGAEHPDQWQGNICEDPIDAQRCPYFTPTQTKETLEENFRRDVENVEWVSSHMPEMYGLFWALDTEVSKVRIPWWKRLWYRMLRIRVEPVQPSYDIAKLLEAPKDT
jgi:hypothetical protein